MIRFLVFILAISGCSQKQDPSRFGKFVSHGVVFQESSDGMPLLQALDNDLILAEYQGTSFLAKDIVSQSPAINSHRKEVAALQAALVLKKAKAQMGTKIVFYGSVEPQNFLRALRRLGESPDPGINIQYAEPIEEQKGVATIDGLWITAEELGNSYLHLNTLERLIHQEILRLVSESVTRKKLYELSKNSGQNIEEFVATKILGGPLRLSNEEFLEFLSNKGIAESDLNENLSKKLMAIAMEDERKKQVAEYLLEEFKKSPVTLKISSPKIKIDLNNEWTVPYIHSEKGLHVDIFTNFTCSACKKTLGQLVEFVEKNPKKINLGLRFYYVDRPVENKMISEAAMCIQAQDQNMFWAFAKEIMAIEGKVVEQQIHQRAEAVGADIKAYKKCFYGGEFREVVKYHMDYAEHIGVRSQPTVIFGNQVLVGTAAEGRVFDMITNEIKAQAPRGFWLNLWQQIKSVFSS